MIDEKDFFRQATLKICGSLEIEKALWDCLMYIRRYIPADLIFMISYDRDLGLGEILAMADTTGGKLTSHKETASKDVQNAIVNTINNPHSSPLLVVTDGVAGHVLTRPFLKLGLKPDAALMIMGPKPEWNQPGGVAVSNASGYKYTREHQRLFSLLSEPFAIAFSNYIRYRELSRLKEILSEDNRYLQNELRQKTGEEIVGANYGLKPVMELVRRIAPLSSPVLLLGETGTGKEVIANAIHSLSPRRRRPLIKVNCGAIAESLMDSELFGHEKGAFTGALFQKRGHFERSNGGTIFLDEIGELTPGAQIRLLRVFQEKEIERVGGTQPIPLDIRVIAATHRNLEHMLINGKFREDLYFRLKVFPIEIPPLRRRRPDIPALVQHFIQKKSREMGLPDIPTLTRQSIEKLMAYDWPGNVRELQNAVERAIILCGNKTLIFDDIIASAKDKTLEIQTADETVSQSLEEVIANHIRKTLDEANGKVAGKGGAAEKLQINPSTLRTKMRKLGIPFGRNA